MRVCIHCGTKQIGGTCVEIEASGRGIIGDLGLPLDAVEADPALVPQISGLRERDPSLLAIVLSHGHRDHWGLVPKVRPDIPIVMGRATEHIMRAAADFVPDAFAPNAWKHLESGKPLQIGPFAITPDIVDHSGFDAYALKIEAGGRRLFYSGDLRARGRKSKLFELMLKWPPQNIDVMLMEGSSLGRLADSESFPTEKALERVFIERFKTTPGNEQGISPHVPVIDKSQREDGTFSREDFTNNEMRDIYTCPAGKTLTTTGHVNSDHALRYLGSVPECRACPLKAKCCPNMPARRIVRDVNEAARDVARTLAKTQAFAQSRRDRKKVEMLFAHLKRILRLDRLRLRGPSGAQFEFTLAAIAQNLSDSPSL